MSDALKTFPDSYLEALTMLYLQNQDLTGKTPEELCALYWDTYYRVYDAGKAAHTEAKAKYRGQ